MGFRRIVHVATTGSTNSDVMAGLSSDPARWAHLTALVARTQTRGRGRAGRSWDTPPEGSALTCSVVIRPEEVGGPLPLQWVPLLVGLAVRRALEPWVAAGLKWPNDLVAADVPDSSAEWGWGPKLGGVLCELHPGGAVVAGIGLNCAQTAAQLPVPWAGSLATVSGRDVTPEEVLPAIGEALSDVLEEWAEDPDRLRAEYSDACVTIGREVRVALPGGGAVTGIAAGVDNEGALVVSEAGRMVAVSAGDVLRAR